MESLTATSGTNPFTATVEWAQENYRTASARLQAFIMNNAIVLDKYRELKEAQALSQDCLAKALASYSNAAEGKEADHD